MSEANQPPANPVFVVGVFRSGTSLLYSLLNQHPQIALMYECDVWDFPGVAGRRRFSGNWLERQEFYNQTLSRHRLIFGGKLKGLETIQTPDDLYECHRDAKSALLCGEKSPAYVTRLAELSRRYPRASFILIWRDPVEVYRSVLRAGQTTSFFRRPGMLHRLIFQQEKMIRDAQQLQEAGARLHHIRYDDLVDRTEATCRATCEFLGVAFQKEMLDLEHADFSAIYQEPQHEFLRRGVIKRQEFSKAVVPAATAAKLQRYATRWQRLSGRQIGPTRPSGGAREPFAVERLYHRIVGKFFFVAENIKRLAFEFLPMPWLRNYRLFKDGFFGGEAGMERRNFRQQLAEHWVTILIGLGVLAGIGLADHFTGPEVSLAAFYALPAMALTIIVGRGWGSFVALLAAWFWSALHIDGNGWNASSSLVLVWNTFMRFAVLQVIVFLLDRIRRELAARSRKA